MSTEVNTRSADQFLPIKERFEALRGAEAFMEEASYAAQIIAKNSSLMQCTAASKMLAVMNVANTGLTLSPVAKLAYLVPRWNNQLKAAECHLEPSYRGLAKLITDTGAVRHFLTGKVYEGDEIRIDKGAGLLEHIPAWSVGKKRGALLAVYSVATMADGFRHIEDMDVAELEKVRECSDAYVKWKKDPKKNSAPHEDWQDEMDRKAVMRRHVKTLPLTKQASEINAAIAIDEAAYTPVPRAADRVAELRRRVIEALEFYQGDDRELLREQCRAKAASGEFTEAFAKQVLAQLGTIEADAD